MRLARSPRAGDGRSSRGICIKVAVRELVIDHVLEHDFVGEPVFLDIFFPQGSITDIPLEIILGMGRGTAREALF